MYIIRSAEEMARFLASQLDLDLSSLLIAKCNELSGYEGYELGNLVSYFEYLMDSLGISVRFNLIKKRPEIVVPEFNVGTQNKDEVTFTHIQSQLVRNQMSVGSAQAYLLAMANENPFDPFADWVSSRPWNGKSRLSDIYETITPEDGHPVAFRDVLIRKWLLSIVAATFKRSGFRARGVLTIQGQQGLGKTSWIANLVTDQRLRDDEEEGLAPATILKIRVVLNRSFELALQWGTAGVISNPVRTVPRIKVNNARERYLTATEAARLKAAVDKSENPQLPYIIGLLLLTGARKQELLKAKWEHIDRERKLWHIPVTKTGKPRYVPLSRPAMEIIDQLVEFEGCPWLLPNPKTLKPYSDIKRPWDTARRLAGLSSLRIHDLRHSAASFMINAGVDLYAVGKILGHADHQSTQRYSHLANDTLMKAVEAGAAKAGVNWIQG